MLSFIPCKHFNKETLVDNIEFRHCHKVANAIGKLVFDGSIETIRCITEHEDYGALTNRTVLLQVAPLLRDKNIPDMNRRNGYLLNSKIYTGRESDAVQRDLGRTTVMSVIEPYLESGVLRLHGQLLYISPTIRGSQRKENSSLWEGEIEQGRITKRLQKNGKSNSSKGGRVRVGIKEMSHA